jgi:N-acyl-D-amino-acid deacylase
MMKRKILLGAMSMLPLLLAANTPAPEYDIVIRGGRVLDGAGSPWVSADVAVKDGRVVRIGRFRARRQGNRRAGRYVSPGFIDMMDQSGRVLVKNGAAENKLLMGVTTVIAGEGGTPGRGGRDSGAFQPARKAGHLGQLRHLLFGDAGAREGDGRRRRAPTPAQLEAMGREVKIAMENGAFGITSALIYPPSSFQTTSDLVTLAKVAAQCDGFYATHMRDESEGLVKAIEEAIEIGEKGGVKVEIFHLKAAYAPGWGKLMPQAVATINAARARGVDVAADLYPYTAGGTGLEIIAPSWVWADGVQKGIERLRDPKVRERMKKEVAAGSMPGWSNLVHASGGFANVRLANGFSDKYKPYHGKSLAEIGKALNRDPADVAWDILLEGLPNRSVALYFMMSEQDIETAIKQPWVSIGSDAAASEKFGRDGRARPAASARLWHLPAHHRRICEAPPGAVARGCGAQDDRLAGAAHGAHRPRADPRRDARRYRRVRSRQARRCRELGKAHRVADRDRDGDRQRRRHDRERQAYRRQGRRGAAA